MTALPDLDRRLSRRIDQGKGIQLTPDDLNLLVASGAYDVLHKAAAEFQRNLCRDRHARAHSIRGANSPSTAGKGGAISKSSGTMKNDDVNEALALARMMSGKGN